MLYSENKDSDSFTLSTKISFDFEVLKINLNGKIDKNNILTS